MSIPQPPAFPAEPPAPAPAQDAAADPASAARERFSPLHIGLIAGCGVMLIATISLGLTTLSLLRTAPTASPTPAPTAVPSAEGGNRTQTIRGIEVVTQSDLEFGDFAMSDKVDGRFTILVAPLAWDDESSGIDASFDVTAYDADGRIVDRGPTNTYVLPGQEGFFQGIFAEDLSDVVRITVEQTRADIEDPLMTGAITMTHSETLTQDGKNYAGGNLTSTLSILPKNPEVFLAGFVDGELFGYCSDLPDIPAGGDFVAICELTPVTKDEHLLDDRIPKDAEFRAYLELDPLSQELT